ncbi:AAA family ATPase [Catellatospora sp. NPDC049609]|uniref:AAA family ATPase n=1 Tax=Catellatospora sp. NPDC049609 TaxID=3155505 RepID=UPI003412BD72
MLVVLVNGLPAAGKTTLARALGRELGLPVLAKDAVKETLADHLPREVSREWSRALGTAAGETLWTLLADSPTGAVVESPWLAHIHHLALAGLARAGVAPETTHEVWCEVDHEVARTRYLARAAHRHPIHRDTVVDVHERFALWIRNATPIGAGTVHRVDTNLPVDVAGLAERIRAAAAGAARPGTPA